KDLTDFINNPCIEEHEEPSPQGYLNLQQPYAPEQARSFTSGNNKSLEDDECFLVPKIVEVDVDEDEPKAKRWNCTDNENKVLDDGYRRRKWKRKMVKGNPYPRETRQVRVRSGTDLAPDDGFCWRKYGQKAILGAKYPRFANHL
ncbi:hypothetical protein Golob_008516, partial [Gossypium lobatum]|nr:hypothetical protein [Gossypium lobatum]